MKRIFSFLTASLLLILLMSSQKVNAQVYSYLDVQQGYETLNLAISGDAAMPANRVYRLQRGGVYLLNGTIKNLNKNPIRIFAADGPGKLPMIIATATQSGVAYRAFELSCDIHLKNLYVSGRNNLGLYTDDGKDMIRMKEIGNRVIVDGCLLEHEWKDFVRMDAKGQKIYILNSVLRNGGDMTDASDNQFLDTRSLDQDSIVIRNSTLHTATGRAIRTGGTGGTLFRNMILDHVTWYQLGNGDGYRGAVDTVTGPLVETRKIQNLEVTNCLFIDMAFHGDEINKYTVNDTLDYPILGFVPISTPGITDESRKIKVTNNVIGTSEALLAYYKSKDTLKAPVLLNKYSINRFFNKYPTNWIQKNNFVENVKFTDAPTSDKIIAYAKFRRENNMTEQNTPDIWQDRNGIGEDPLTWGPADKEFDFSYAKSYKSYYSGERGLPIGDLNWFPDMKKIWEAGGSVGIDKQDNSIVTEYSLDQNYPNPFNPSTMISFSLPKQSNVSLKIYNMLGQEIASLINNEIVGSGKYTVEWNSKDAANQAVATGVYVYQLKADNMVISKKMLLVK